MTISPGDALAWGRLGDALIQRRLDLDLHRYRSRRAFCDDRQIDYRVIFDIENAKRSNFGRATLLDIARAYAITPESMERKLHGHGELEPVPEPPARPLYAVPPLESSAPPEAVTLPADMAVMAQDMALRSILPGIYTRARGILARNPRATGRDIFPGETEAPKIWDGLRQVTYPAEDGTEVHAFTLDECALYAAAAHLEEERRKRRDRRSG